MKGNITRRGKRSWRIKYELGADPATSKRRTHYRTLRGTKKEAEAEAAKIIASLSTGTYVEGSKETVAEFSERWLSDWAQTNVSNRTFDLYAQILRNHISARIGATLIQKLTAGALQNVYANLARSGLSPRTVLHVHRVVHLMLRHAHKWGTVNNNVASIVDAPKVPDTEIEILMPAEIKTMFATLKSHSIQPIALLALATGMRRGELLAIRWQDVDLERGLVRVERSLEHSKRAGLVFKSPKTRHGRRTITLPTSMIVELRGHRKACQEHRLALGGGRLPDDGLVFSNPADGSPLTPTSVTKAWTAAAAKNKIAKTLHSLRHTHASALIAAGMDVLTVSRRLGHGSAAITLKVYGHLFRPDDRAAQAIEGTLAETM